MHVRFRVFCGICGVVLRSGQDYAMHATADLKEIEVAGMGNHRNPHGQDCACTAVMLQAQAYYPPAPPDGCHTGQEPPEQGEQGKPGETWREREPLL